MEMKEELEIVKKDIEDLETRLKILRKRKVDIENKLIQLPFKDKYVVVTYDCDYEEYYVKCKSCCIAFDNIRLCGPGFCPSTTTFYDYDSFNLPLGLYLASENYRANGRVVKEWSIKEITEKEFYDKLDETLKSIKDSYNEVEE